jgi:aspartate-semialdehyde dehydrogenase
VAKLYNVAVVGATGAVGEEMLKILDERNFPIKELKLLASKRSKGKKIEFKDKEYIVEEATKDAFKEVDIALFSAGASRSKEFAPYAVDAGAVVIDNSSAFRMDNDVPLVVPEVNPEDILKHKGIIANPNCTTIIMLMAVKPLYDYAKVKRIIVSTYQSASGAGAQAMKELEDQVKAWANNEELPIEKFPYQLLFNTIPQVDVFLDNDYTKEEMKMVNETRKMLHDDNILVSATCVRLPVFRAHSEAVTVELEKDITKEKAMELIDKFPGVKVVDDNRNSVYPMPLFVSNKDDCEVGRIREDLNGPNWLTFWIVGDQIRKGAALNAVQIAEKLIEKDN